LKEFVAAIDDILVERAQAYAGRHRLALGRRLGSGNHGIVLDAASQAESGESALKIHKDIGAYGRERDVYRRLAEHLVLDIHGFKVPEMLGCDDELLAIEMTIVTRPFLLDFAGAYLEKPPEFPDDVWENWEEEKQEQFGDRWPVVEEVLQTLKRFGVYMLDVSPANIAFLDHK